MPDVTLSAIEDTSRGRQKRWPIVLSVALLGGTLLPILGCGESQEDRMMRAARRARPTSESGKDEDKDKKEVPKEAKEKAGVTQANRRKARVPDRELEVNQDKASIGEASGIVQEEELAILPIDQRKPGTPLGRGGSRKRSAENLERISKGLLKYHNDKKLFPRTYSKTATGIPTLSWRVELLPYLGYETLSKKFDWTVPWNREPNLSLLEFIPDEFVSPERFDTKTNYLLPAHRLFMFADNKKRAQHNIEDGYENTIMVVEVNDRLAVPWTKPEDYVPENVKDFGQDLGGLRGDGAFAVWANGWTTLLANELTAQQIFHALTYETGDGQLAGHVHRDISIGGVSDASVAAVDPETNHETPQPTGPRVIPQPAEQSRVREPVPKAVDVAASQKRLRTLYADRIKEASEDDEKKEVASEMLMQAGNMESDRPGAYALQSAAMHLAIEAGNPSVLIAAIDQRVGIFDVDAYEENVTWLTAFGQGTISKDPDVVDGDELLRRSVRVIYAGISDNDFLRASNAARLAYRFSGQEPRDVIPKLLSRIRVLLGTSKREYDDAVKHLKIFRDDPSNVDAGAAFGQFLCFIKGDWENGLPLLAKGGSKQLQAMAKLDLRGARSSIETIALGDAWWDLSERARGGVYRQAAQDRAIHWYGQVYDSLSESLDKMHVKSRLDEAEGMDGSSPIALCLQLADELGVDLQYGLAAIADVGQDQRGGKGANVEF